MCQIAPLPGLHTPFSSHPCLETSPAATPLLAVLAVSKSPCAVMLMPSLTKATPFLPILSRSSLPQAYLPQRSSTWAAVQGTDLSLSPAETQDQLGLIRQEIRSWQEQLPLLEVEENIEAFVGNATSVLEEYREPIITLDRLR